MRPHTSYKGEYGNSKRLNPHTSPYQGTKILYKRNKHLLSLTPNISKNKLKMEADYKYNFTIQKMNEDVNLPISKNGSRIDQNSLYAPAEYISPRDIQSYQRREGNIWIHSKKSKEKYT